MATTKGMKIQQEPFRKGRHLVRALKLRHWTGMSRDRNVVGAAFGQRYAHGEQTDTPALVVYVARKLPGRFLPASRLLPRKMYIGGDCVEVDVVETGPIYPFAFTARERPATAGISVGHPSVTAGTLGAIVTDNTDGSTCILSNNHVLANQNAANVGDSALQPGTFDGGVDTADAIASLKRFVMINATGNTVDAAIAQVSAPVADNILDQVHNNVIAVANADHPAVGLLFAGGCNRTIMCPIDMVLAQLNITFPAGRNSTVAADIGMAVEKVGRTTEYTTSSVKEIDVTVSIDYDFGPAEFVSQVATAWMSDPGDSGSLICRGGAGGDESHCDGCAGSSAAASLLGESVRAEKSMALEVRDKFLRQTKAGRWAIDMYYNNEERVMGRLAQTSVSDEDRDFARKLFGKYRDEARQAFSQGVRSEQVLTEHHLRDAKAALRRAEKHLERDELDAAQQLLAMAEKHAKGKTAKDILALMNNDELLEQVQKILGAVKFLRPPEPPCQ